MSIGVPEHVNDSPVLFAAASKGLGSISYNK
jgi:hypothetical protein